MTILEEAAYIVSGDRAADYGEVKASFARVAKLWSTLLNTEVTADQVGLCMIALKLSRYTISSKRDTLIDIAGYARTLEMLHD